MFNPRILRFESLDSTNLEAMRLAKTGAPEDLCIVSREQTQGRGRLARSWHSPKGAGLYVSMLLRPRLHLSRWPLLGLAAALAVSDALRQVCGFQPDVKWPNDLCVDGRKLCGILAETVETPSGPAAIVGIGVNLNDAGFPPELRHRATSIRSVCAGDVDAEILLAALVKAFAERLESLESQHGSESTIREWCANSSYAFGRRVNVSLGDENFSGVTRGLEADGALRVERADGSISIVRAGDVTALRPSANNG